VAAAAVTLYTAGTIKDLPGIRTYVAVDGGMSDNLARCCTARYRRSTRAAGDAHEAGAHRRQHCGVG
jgi:diaminopimelate decarboxylase